MPNYSKAAVDALSTSRKQKSRHLKEVGMRMATKASPASPPPSVGLEQIFGLNSDVNVGGKTTKVSRPESDPAMRGSVLSDMFQRALMQAIMAQVQERQAMFDVERGVRGLK